jgi:ATP-dependent Clp protease ATP-binding subunit ClpX
VKREDVGKARGAPQKAETLTCSFCGKSCKAVKKMVQGPDGVAICNECVEVIVDIFEDEGIGSNRSTDSLRRRSRV